VRGKHGFISGFQGIDCECRRLCGGGNMKLQGGEGTETEDLREELGELRSAFGGEGRRATVGGEKMGRYIRNTRSLSRSRWKSGNKDDVLVLCGFGWVTGFLNPGCVILGKWKTRLAWLSGVLCFPRFPQSGGATPVNRLWVMWRACRGPFNPVI